MRRLVFSTLLLPRCSGALLPRAPLFLGSTRTLSTVEGHEMGGAQQRSHPDIAVTSPISPHPLPSCESFDGQTATNLSYWVRKFPWLLFPPDDISVEFIEDQAASLASKSKLDKMDAALMQTMLTSEIFCSMDVQSKYKRIQKSFYKTLEPLFEVNAPTTVLEFMKVCEFADGPIPGCRVVGYLEDSKKSIHSVLQRLLEPFNSSTRIVHIQETDRQQLFTQASDKQVLVLDGESGSGKTHAALAANPDNPTIFLQFTKDFRLTIDLPLDDSGLPQIHGDDRKRFVAYVMECIESCIRCRPATPFLRNKRIHLVVDELGQKPNTTRLFISCNSALRRDLAAFLRCDANNIRISCLGTGVNDASIQLSSDPNLYITRRMNPSSHSKCSENNIILQLFTAMEQSAEVPDLSGLDAVRSFSTHPLIQPLMANYRSAVLVASHIRRVLHSIRGSAAHYTLQHSKEHCVYSVAQSFHALNGLESIKGAALMDCCAHAFRLALCGPTVEESFDRPLSVEEEQLVSRLGILTERSHQIHEARHHSIAPTLASMPTKETLELPRFTISRSIALMMLANFGMNHPPISAQSGEGLEFGIVQKAILTFRCCQSAQQARRVLLCAEPRLSAERTFDVLSQLAAAAGEQTLLHSIARGQPPTVGSQWRQDNAKVILMMPQARLSKGNERKSVSTKSRKQSNSKVLTKAFLLTPKGTQLLKMLTSVKRAVEMGNRVVISNGAKAPYADVVLIAPGFLCFVQCKQAAYAGKKKDVNREMNKIFTAKQNKDITNCLCHIAGVAKKDITVLYPMTNEGPNLEKCRTKHCALHKVRAAAPDEQHKDVLFPFMWSTTPIQRDEEFSFPVSRKFDFTSIGKTKDA